MAKEKKIEEPKVDLAEARRANVNQILDKTKEQDLPVILVLGVQEDGVIVFNTNVPQYQYMQWLLSRAIFELNVHEKNLNAENAQKVAA